MSILPSFVRSVILTSIVTFLAPMVGVGLLLLGLLLLGQVPTFTWICQAGMDTVLYVLNTFGSGCALTGMLLIGSVCSLVGVLFDGYTLYHRYKFLDP